jgi:hypothetical protein
MLALLILFLEIDSLPRRIPELTVLTMGGFVGVMWTLWLSVLRVISVECGVSIVSTLSYEIFLQRE